MPQHLFQLSANNLAFPDIDSALSEPDGLLAYGGDLSNERLLSAYSKGIFPWYSDDSPILWWSPSERGILKLTDFKCSKSLAKKIRQQRYTVTLNHAFEGVINACANVPRNDAMHGTWITDEMIDAYINLHQQGHAHSIEVWHQQQLVGGLYGVGLNNVFCGESMFHIETDCSKIATYYLVQWLKQHDFAFIDCQLVNPHLSTLGVKGVARDYFLSKLNQAQNRQPRYTNDIWQPRELS